MKKMKRNIFYTSIMLAGLISGMSAEQNGLFVGGSTGFTTLTKVYPDRSNSIITPDMMSFGVNLGYSYYLNSYFGVRGYLDGFYNFSYSIGRDESTPVSTHPKIVSTSNSYIQGGLNLDLVYDLFRGLGTAFGVYAGAGGAWGIYGGSSGLVIPINAGFSVLFRDNQRFDIGLKIPINGVEVGGVSYQNMIVSLRYYYIFNF